MRVNAFFPRGLFLLSAVVCALSIAAAPAAAQSYTVLHGFDPSPLGPRAGVVQGSDGNFYGTTVQGGARGFGTVFNITPAGALTTLHSFEGTGGSEGAFPDARLVQGSDGAFYGTTGTGGIGLGTIFQITAAGQLTTLYSFSSFPESDGRYPSGVLVEGSGGDFYGTTIEGGAGFGGTVFKITAFGELSTLHSFGGSDGAYPTAGLLLGTDGNFYGTTGQGGASGFGTVFKMTPAGALTTLHSFARSDGAGPSAELVQGSDGNFYGTTVYGGVSDFGTIFKITPAGVLTTLHSFTGSDGANPSSGLVEGSDGDFYGTTSSRSASDKGTIFKITPAATLTTLHSFAGSDGANPYGGLFLATDGNFYGTTYEGGASGYGTVFKITPTGTLTTVHSFTRSDAVYPYAGLVEGSDGNFYGTTEQGGARGYGTVFNITPAGALTTLYSFAGSDDGAFPDAGLVQGSDGDFYGTTQQGGAYAYEYGAVFKITPTGELTTLHSFTLSDGANPYAGLVQGSDGNFYGTTVQGGASGYGTVFKITPAGALTTLHSFTRSDGANPYAGLVRGSDGDFYGTTYAGGALGFGTIFKITPAGTLTTLYSFEWNGNDGAYPHAGLIQATDGDFYGTTYEGGAIGLGTIFKITPAGTLTTLYSFAWTDGTYPHAGLIQATDGDFYGTTGQGGASDYGTVFKVTPAGALTTLHSFAGSDGQNPYAGLIQGTDGNFYGTTTRGGPLGGGVVFKLALPAGGAVVSGGGTICVGGSATIQASLTGTPPWSLSWSDGVMQSGVTVSPATRTVSPTSTTVFTLTAFSDASGPGTFSGSATVTVRALPAVSIAAGGPTTFCQGGSVVLSATPSGGSGTFSSYQWYRDAVAVPGVTAATYPATASGNYAATVTDSTGCVSGASNTVLVSVLPLPTATVSGTAAICKGASTTLQAALTGTPPWNLIWSDGFIQSAVAVSPATRTVTPTDTTTYTVTSVSDANCTGGTTSGSAVVAVEEPPTATVSGDTTICAGSSTVIQAALTGAAPWNLIWSDGFTQTVSASPATRTVSPASHTIFRVTSVSDAACSGTSSGNANVKVDSLPSADISAPASVCASSTKNTASVPNAGGQAAYSWSITNGTITKGAGTKKIEFTAGSSGPVSLSVTVTSPAGCTTAGTVGIPVVPGC